MSLEAKFTEEAMKKAAEKMGEVPETQNKMKEGFDSSENKIGDWAKNYEEEIRLKEGDDHTEENNGLIKDEDIGDWTKRGSTEGNIEKNIDISINTDENKLGDWAKNYMNKAENTDVKEADSEVKQMPTKNQALEGQKHPETGVEFERKVVENSDGEKVEVVVPKFESKFDVQLPDDLIEATDKEQFDECNRQLKEAVENDPELAEQFTEEQLEQIMDGETPDGYTWHHDAEKGKMQLVDSKTHAQTGHTGGKAIWGGGKENR